MSFSFNRGMGRTVHASLAILLAASCAHVQPKPDFDTARSLIESSTGRERSFDPLAPAFTQADVDELLEDGLSLDETLHLALVNNRELQAEFQGIGVAHADWVQSKLLSNPSLDFLLAFPTVGGRAQLELGLSANLLELWDIPVRAASARKRLDATVLRIARRAGERLDAAQTAYYAAVAAGELVRVAEEEQELNTRSFQTVRDLHQAGAADALDENFARGPLLISRVRLDEALIDSSNAMRELAKLLSLTRPVSDLLLTDSLPLKCEPLESSEDLVLLALRSRLDLQALKAEVAVLQGALSVEQRKTWGEASVGGTLERPAGEEGGLVGVGAGLTLPVFDQNQAQVARAEFRLEQGVKLYESALIAVAQNVRASVLRVNSANRSLEFYAETLLPHAVASLELTHHSLENGHSTVLTLLEVQRQLLEARRAHVTLQLEAAVATSELKRLVGTTGIGPHSQTPN